MAQMATIPPKPTGPRIRGPVLTLVALPSRRAQFFANLAIALAPGKRKLPSEVTLGLVSSRGIGVSTFLHVVAMALWLILPKVLPQPVIVGEQDRPVKDDIVYYHAAELPQMEDAGGSGAGRNGKPGGSEAFHPTQVIRISRAPSLIPSVVDDPKLFLPRVKGPSANLLSLVPAPLSSLPRLAPAPVAVPVRQSNLKIAKPAAPMPKPDLSLAQGTLPEIMPTPVSAVAKAEPESRLTLPPSPAVALPARGEVAVASNLTTELTVAPLRPVPAPAAPEANATGSGGAMSAEAVVIATNPGDVLGAPVNGAPGSLAMSPKGHTQPGIGGEGGGTGIARGAGAGAGAVGPGPGASGNGSGPGFSPLASNGTTLARGTGGSGNNGTPAIPGVVVRGGVVSLGSFAPKAVPDAKSPTPAAPRKAAAITVIATSRSGGGLSAYGRFRSQQVYTIYIDTKTGPVVLQFAGRELAASYNGDLTPPDPINTELPQLPAGAGVVVACVLDVAGHVQNVHLMRSGLQSSQALLEAVRNWQFHPALSAGEPVAVDALIGIGTGVR
jgi:hypothetical protein